MAEYYVRITDEEPVDMEKGVRFKYNTDGESADFVIVDENSYETLVEAFQQFSTDFESAVNYNLDNLLDNKIVKMSDKSNKIVEDVTDEDSDSISFAQLRDVITNYVSNSSFNALSNLVSNLNSTLFTLVSRVNSIDSSKASTSQLSTLESNIRGLFNNYYNKSNVDAKLNGKANTTHTHGWRTVDTLGGWDTSDCRLEVNEQIRMCHYRISSSFQSATAGKLYEWGSGSIGNIPRAYRPKRAFFGSARVQGGILGTIYVNSEGKIGGVFSKGWSNANTVYGDIYWNY